MKLPIFLSEDEVNYCKKLAKLRNAKVKRFGSKTLNNAHTSEKIHLLGILGEFAVSSLFNQKINTEIYEDKGDSGFDLRIKGYNIDVKISTYKDCWLKLIKSQFEKKPADIYVLCYVSKSNYKKVYLVGWILNEEVTNFPLRRMFKNGPLDYLIKEHQLRTPESLIDLMLSGIKNE